MKRPGSRHFKLCLFALAIVLMPLHLLGEQGSSTGASPSRPATDYTIGPGDVLGTTIGDAPDLSGNYRVTQTGWIVLPGLSTPIKAEGLTAQQESQAIAAALKRDKLLRNPRVNVYVVEYHSRTVTVLGAVLKPSVYPLQGPTTLVEVLSTAGGLLPTAGSTVQITHKAPAASTAASQNETIALAKLLSGADPSLNREVRAGDVIAVSTAPVVYVIGAVMKPGGYALQDASTQITVLRALAMAQGLSPVASRGRALILRRSEGGDQQDLPIDVGKLMTGKLADVSLEANDVLFIPESGRKKGLNTLRAAALQAMEGVSIYGVGYRVAGR